jgi:hypothetical protein
MGKINGSDEFTIVYLSNTKSRDITHGLFLFLAFHLHHFSAVCQKILKN